MAETHDIARRHLHQSALQQKRNYDVRAKIKPKCNPGDLVRYYYVLEKARNKLHRCYVGPYQVISHESDMNYRICGKLRDSGREDIRIVHADHLIHFEQDPIKHLHLGSGRVQMYPAAKRPFSVSAQAPLFQEPAFLFVLWQ